MGSFAGMNDATRGYVSNYLMPGKFVVRIDGCASFEKEGVGRMWKNDLTILAVEQGDDHKEGDQVQTFFKLDTRYPKMFYGKIMSFIAGVMGVTDDEIGEKETEEVLSEDEENPNPLAGMVCVVTAVPSASKKAKNEDGTPKVFTNYSWGTALDDDEIEAAIGAEAVERFFPNGL